MKSVCALLLFVIFSIYVNAQTSDVVVLTTANFDELTKEGDWLLEFYAPWCGHCKKLEPAYNELATAVKGKFNVGKVDCTVEKALQTRFGIRGYPTIKFLKDQQVHDYSGDRSVGAFTTYMEGGFANVTPKPLPAPVAAEEAAAPAPAPAPAPASAPAPANPNAGKDTIVLREDNFHAQITKGDWLVKFYAPWCGHCKRLAPIWDEAATALKGKAKLAKVDCTVHKGVCDEMHIRGYPTVYHFKDGKMREYDGGRSTEDFKAFLEEGYKKVQPQDIPEAPSAIMRQFNSMLGQLETLLQANVWLVLGFSALVGVALGLLVICLVPGGKSEPVVKPKPASAKKAEVEAEAEAEVEEEEEKEEVSKKDD